LNTDTPVTSEGSRCELDPANRAVDGPGERLAQHGLADSRHVLDQEVSLGQQHDQRQPGDLGLALDHLLDAGADAARDTGQGVKVGPRTVWRAALLTDRTHVLG
jgi:hypothetical protein